MSLKMMLFKLLRSIILGLIAAAILLFLYRSIKIIFMKPFRLIIADR